MPPGTTCSPTSKDTTIVSGSIPPSGISPPNRQNAKPLNPVSTKSQEGHSSGVAERGNRELRCRCGLDCDVTPPAAGQDRQDRRRGFGARATGAQTRRTAWIKGLLFSQGVSGYEPLRRNRRQRLDELKTGDGRPLPPHLKSQIGRELDRLELLLGQIKAVEAERDALLTPATETEGMPAPQAMLIDLRGIGTEFAAVVWSEGLCRSFANRRQVAAYGGLAPWQSGSVAREQGVSKAA